MNNTKSKKQEIKKLLESRKKVLGQIKRLDAVFQEEKENEDAWPGHEGTKYQTADADYQVLLNHLGLIDKELKKLGVELKNYGKTN